VLPNLRPAPGTDVSLLVEPGSVGVAATDDRIELRP